MQEEVWKDIEGYEGWYQVSDQGRVRSLPRTVIGCDGVKKSYRGKILASRTDRGGYKIIDLRKGKEKRTLKVHRLVAEAFIPNPENKPEVNHIQEVRKDLNCVSNLEWMTSKENMNYGTLNERKAKRYSKTVYQYTLQNELVQIWDSTKSTRKRGFSPYHVSHCCRGVNKTHKGFKWSYEPIQHKIKEAN